jgi:type IV secretory pathway VirB2 component (pilin)
MNKNRNYLSFEAVDWCNIFLFLCLSFVLLHVPEWLWAASGDDPFATSKTKAADVFNKIRDIVLILGGIGILSMSVMAFFGKFRWLWLLSLVGGLVMVLVASSFINYFSGQQVGISDGSGGI